MDVLLINPPYNLKKNMGKLADLSPKAIPIALAYIASNLIKNKISVEIIDAQVHKHDFNTLKEKILKEKPLVVGLTAATPTIHIALKVAAAIKKISLKPKVVLGGPHASFMSNEMIKSNHIDIVVRGEGETIMVDLVKSIKNNKGLKHVKGITYLENNKIKTNPPAKLIENLDELPFPARELLPIEKYKPQPDMVIRAPAKVLTTSRGCPYNCIYCGSRYISGKKYRYYRAEKAIEEIELLINKYAARQLIFWDDSFIINEERTKKLCNLMIEKGINKKVVWYCCTRVNTVTPGLLKLMYKAGCRIISYGIETASQRLLNKIKKGITIEQIENAVKWTNEAKIECRATFMLGIPTETRKESLATIKFAKHLNLSRVKFSLATPYPGTEFYGMVKDELGGHDWTEYNVMSGFTENDVLYVSKGRTSKDLKKLQRRAMAEFYLRPKIIFRLLTKIRGWEQIREYFLGARILISK